MAYRKHGALKHLDTLFFLAFFTDVFDFLMHADNHARADVSGFDVGHIVDSLRDIALGVKGAALPVKFSGPLLLGSCAWCQLRGRNFLGHQIVSRTTFGSVYYLM